MLLILSLPAAPLAQPTSPPHFEYLSPVPGSRLVSPKTNVIVRWGGQIARESIRQDGVRVVGSASGECKGRVSLSDDERTILWTPAFPFQASERVTVETGPTFRSVTGKTVPPLSFSFTVSQGARPAGHLLNSRNMDMQNAAQRAYAPAGRARRVDSLLPPDFPAVNVLTNSSVNHNEIFLGSFTWDALASTPYLMILNRNGDPVFYRRGVEGWGFTPQPGGTLTYFDMSSDRFVALDSAYHEVDQFVCGNGYNTNNHELRMLSNGHALLIGYDEQNVAMDTVVEGGDPSAWVIGNVIQELDRDKNVVFQWRSWDHFKITDATDVDLTGATIDAVHANSIDIDADGNILLSSRNLDEVTKIDGKTGEIIWRLGGKNNQFTFVDDPDRFERQHAARWLPNGNIILYDNGTNKGYSRAIEYALNESDSTATLVWEFRHSPEISSWALGSAQRLPDGNTLIGWGTANSTLSEVTPAGDVLFELDLPEYVYTYRAYTFPWTTNAFVPAADSLSFPETAVGDSVWLDLAVSNPTLSDVQLTSLPTRTPVFQATSPTPVSLPAGGSVQVRIAMRATEYGLFRDTLDIRSEDSTQGIVRRVRLQGSSPLPTIATNPSSCSFAGQDSVRTVNIGNSSVNTLLIDSVYTLTSYFSVSRSQLAVAASDSVRVIFHPSQKVSVGDTLYLRNNSITPLVAVPLLGNPGLPGLATSATVLDFGVVTRGDSVTLPVVVRSTGLAPLTITGVQASVSAFLPLLMTPVTLSAFDSLSFWVRFRPASYGQYTDTLVIASDAGNVSVALRGAVLGPVISTSVTSLNFGNIQRGDSSTLPVVVRSATAFSLMITGAAVAVDAFTPLLATPIVVNAHDSISVPVRFRPASAGVYADTLVIVSDGGTVKVALRGEARNPSTGITRETLLVPSTFLFPQNYPNPFNGTTTITFAIPAPSRVVLTMYDVMGKEVSKLEGGERAAGYYRYEWHPGAIASGMYYCRLTATPLNNEKYRPFDQVKKMLLMK